MPAGRKADYMQATYEELKSLIKRELDLARNGQREWGNADMGPTASGVQISLDSSQQIQGDLPWRKGKGALSWLRQLTHHQDTVLLAPPTESATTFVPISNMASATMVNVIGDFGDLSQVIYADSGRQQIGDTLLAPLLQRISAPPYSWTPGTGHADAMS